MAERQKPRRRARGNSGEGPRALTEVWRVELTRGLRCLADGDTAAAEGHFVRAHTSSPDRPEVCFALGRERLRQGRARDAEALLRLAWEGGILAAAAALARCLGADPRRVPEAHLVLDEALAEQDEPGLLAVRAEIHLAEGAAGPARAAMELARTILETEQREAPATRAALLAAEARILNLEGIELGGSDRRDEALFAFKRAFDLEPTWAAPLVNMGAVFARLGRPARARACYDRALVLDGNNAVAHYNLAELARLRGESKAAELGYRRVLEIAPSYPGARVSLAEVLLGAGDVEQVLEVLASGEPVVDGESVVAACRLAKALVRAGHYEEAARIVKVAKESHAERVEDLLGR